MEKIKVGYYARFRTLSNKVKIGRVVKIDNNIYELDKNEVTTDKYIIGEPSENIIDLIEPGDYVNGYKVKITNPYMIVLDNYNFKAIENKDIKSVVTKEQFNSAKYEVG